MTSLVKTTELARRSIVKEVHREATKLIEDFRKSISSSSLAAHLQNAALSGRAYEVIGVAEYDNRFHALQDFSTTSNAIKHERKLGFILKRVEALLSIALKGNRRTLGKDPQIKWVVMFPCTPNYSDSPINYPLLNPIKLQSRLSTLRVHALVHWGPDAEPDLLHALPGVEKHTQPFLLLDLRKTTGKIRVINPLELKSGFIDTPNTKKA